ncbi:MAG: hypothetical protein CVT66_10640 [Actinobacteria bacterium HGW-Actinobacteria-6]|jgi:hypothetical protein|nr:MAG: hypothetical protein CVT66_10640 [Actinobacteria bacterium HGW-Actinobacteria-6]
MFPPMLLYLRFSTPERTRHGVWLPLFLIWLLLLPLIVLVLTVTVAIDFVLLLAGQAYHHYTLLVLRAFGLLGATRGTVVHVHSDDTNVDIEFV